MISRRSGLSERKSWKKTAIFTRFSALWVTWTVTNARIFWSGVPGDLVDPLEVLEALLVDVLKDLEEEVLLGGDVVVEAALEDPDRVGDVLDRGRLVALLVEDARCGLEDLLAASAGRARAAPALGSDLCLHLVRSSGALSSVRISEET